MFALTFRVGHQLESAAPRIRNENERGAAPRRRAKNNHNGQVDGCLGAWMFGCADASGCLDGLFLSKVTQTHACSGRANTNKNGINSLKTGTKCCSVFFFSTLLLRKFTHQQKAIFLGFVSLALSLLIRPN